MKGDDERLNPLEEPWYFPGSFFDLEGGRGEKKKKKKTRVERRGNTRVAFSLSCLHFVDAMCSYL